MRTNPDPTLRLIGFAIMVFGAVLVGIGLVELLP